MVALKDGGEISLPSCRLTLNWSVIAVAKHDYRPTGDGYGIWRQEGRVLFAVADGTGSGSAAADAVESCLDSLADSLGVLSDDFQTCHQALKGSRGAAMALMVISTQTGVMTWAAVGDVDGVLMRPALGSGDVPAAITRIGGTLGITYNGIVAHSHKLEPGDMLVMTTDGVLRDFSAEISLNNPAETVVAQILRDFRRAGDDSLVMAIAVTALA